MNGVVIIITANVSHVFELLVAYLQTEIVPVNSLKTPGLCPAANS